MRQEPFQGLKSSFYSLLLKFLSLNLTTTEYYFKPI